MELVTNVVTLPVITTLIWLKEFQGRLIQLRVGEFRLCGDLSGSKLIQGNLIDYLKDYQVLSTSTLTVVFLRLSERTAKGKHE
ncbi:MAG: hypothetical protein IPN81_11080 [Nitrosomonadales bacterium]|nr:hypothetical protein [Nitrosomonadales bacterium]